MYYTVTKGLILMTANEILRKMRYSYDGKKKNQCDEANVYFIFLQLMK